MPEPEIKITFESEPYQKIRYYTKLVDSEISGMGRSVINKDGEIIVKEIIIFEQECTGAHTDLSDEAMAKFLYELQKDKKDPKEWNIWWHSHNDMGCFWSATDDETILGHETQDFLISIVTNKKSEFKARVDIFPEDHSPFNAKIFKTYDAQVFYLIPKKERKEKETKQEDLEIKISNLEDRITKIDEKKEELEKKKEELEEQVDQLDSNLFENKELEKICQDEVNKKVNIKKPKKTYNFHSKSIDTITRKSYQQLDYLTDRDYWNSEADEEYKVAPNGRDRKGNPIALTGLSIQSGYPYGSVADEEWWLGQRPSSLNADKPGTYNTNVIEDEEDISQDYVGRAHEKSLEEVGFTIR